jgi:hypothetical protein
VITKWDLLRDLDVEDDARLKRVRKFLMSNQGFRDLVEAHGSHRVVRLIPVSAVGPDFAEVDEQGPIAKLPDGQMRPSNVDVSLAAVVPTSSNRSSGRWTGPRCGPPWSRPAASPVAGRPPH